MNDEPPASFSIVILASGGVDAAVVEQLDRLATLSGPPREVCLVHGPLPGPLVPDVTGRVKLVHEPLGHDAVARNHGLANAAGDAVVFHTASPPAADLLAVLCEAFSDRGVAAVVSGPECVAFRRVDLQAMRGFDEARGGGDELRDACQRLEAMGRKVVWSTDGAAQPPEPVLVDPHRRLMSPGLALRHRRSFMPLVRGSLSRSECSTGEQSDARTSTRPRSHADGGDRDPLASTRETLRLIWAGLLPRGSRCALVGYPDHWNVGDAAIWWGTRRLLNTIGVAVDYACDPWSYEPAALRMAVPEGPILILGGGNLGDAYRHEQSLRERILGDFPKRRIIQLPQSIWFSSQKRAEALADLLVHAADVTLLLRDAASLAFAREMFCCDSALCPDAAIALDLAGVGGPPEVPLLALWRTDTEARETSGSGGDDLVVGDWTAPGPEVGLMSTAARGFKEWVGDPPPEIGSCPPRRRMAWRHLPWLWDQLAEDRTLRGCRLLSRGRVVLTDRLHAHLLCTLMRKPQVVCDSTNGKIFAYRDTWRVDDPLVRFASTRAEAVEHARELLASMAGQEAGGGS
jgi:pyruvyl transferase EpsO